MKLDTVEGEPPSSLIRPKLTLADAPQLPATLKLGFSALAPAPVAVHFRASVPSRGVLEGASQPCLCVQLIRGAEPWPSCDRSERRSVQFCVLRRAMTC